MGSKKYHTQRADTPACAPKSGQKPERKVLLEEKEKRKEKSPGAPGIGGVTWKVNRLVQSPPRPSNLGAPAARRYLLYPRWMTVLEFNWL